MDRYYADSIDNLYAWLDNSDHETDPIANVWWTELKALWRELDHLKEVSQ